MNDDLPSDLTGLAFARRVLIGTAVVVSVLLSLLLVWFASDLLMLIFASILVSIPLRRLTALVQRRTSLKHGAALALVTIALFTLSAGVVWIAAERLVSQWNELASQLQNAIATVGRRLQGFAWAQQAIERLPSLGELFLGSGMLSRMTSLFSSTVGAVVNVVLVAVIAIYFASQPELYARGLKRLVPVHYRSRAGEILGELDEALGRWLIGRLGLMVINGTLTTVALWVLGVPLALTLGLIAGLLNFIPNFGPFIAAVPAVLIAFVQSPTLAIYTALVYLAIQMVDGYVLTPLVDRRSVDLPPVLTISAQLLLGVLFGFIGLLVASPLTATLMILVQMLYVEDVLGDRVRANGSES